MATYVKPDSDASVTTLVSGIINDAQELLKQQFALLKQEVRQDLQKTRDAAIALGVGAIVGLIGAIVTALALVHLLAWAFPTLEWWACYGIVGVAILILAAGLCYAGIAKFKSFNPLPDESARALKENVQWLTNPK